MQVKRLVVNFFFLGIPDTSSCFVKLQQFIFVLIVFALQYSNTLDKSCVCAYLNLTEAM